MTCYLRDRDQPNAVDGGLCIPNAALNVTAFCSQLTGKPASIVVPTVYQVSADECQLSHGNFAAVLMR